jgi:Flp pilus assembly pilin Flp
MMFRQKRNFRAQSITEYVIIIGLVSIALIAMQNYMKRGIQAVIQSAADDVGAQKDAAEIDPVKGETLSSRFETTSLGKVNVEVSGSGSTSRVIDRESSTTGTSTSRITDKTKQ